MKEQLNSKNDEELVIFLKVSKIKWLAGIEFPQFNLDVVTPIVLKLSIIVKCLKIF